MPLSEAGMRRDPAVSVPRAAGTMPLASAAADPPLEPPADRSSAKGFPTWSVVPPAANSCVCACPTRTMPAAASRAHTVASPVATLSASTRLDAVIGSPLTSMRSFRATGMPHRNGAAWPSRVSTASAATAMSCARSGYSLAQALTALGVPSKLGGPPLRSAIRRWQAASSSTADSSRLRNSCAESRIPRSAGFVTVSARLFMYQSCLQAKSLPTVLSRSYPALRRRSAPWYNHRMIADAASEQPSAGVSAERTAVHVAGLHKRYGDVAAVDDVELTIREGEFFTMLGPSGSGKTTLLRLIAGFERPDAGRIELAGRDVTGRPPYLRDVNTVFQDYALFPHMTVGENVAYGLRVKGVPRTERRKRVDEILEVVRLPRLGDRKPAQLSGGQRQRVALARALVNHPQVLLLDEPLGALDLKLREQMQVELKAIQRRVGITFIYVTHDQGEALSMSDRVAVFNQGKIEQMAAPSELYERPKTAFVAGFVGISNLVSG